MNKELDFYVAQNQQNEEKRKKMREALEEYFEWKKQVEAARKNSKPLTPPPPAFVELAKHQRLWTDEDEAKHAQTQQKQQATQQQQEPLESEPLRDIRDYKGIPVDDGVMYVDEKGEEAFFDSKDTISLLRTEESDILAAMQLGLQKWGNIEVYGNDKFKEQCIYIAAKNNINFGDEETQRKIAELREQMNTPAPVPVQAPVQEQQQQQEEEEYSSPAPGM
jgi:hypothetical protein